MDSPDDSASYSLFSEILGNLSPHPRQAQIVLQVEGDNPSLDRALELLAAEPGSGPSEAVLVVSASPKDCMEAVLRLTENGFNRLQAIYPPAPR